MVRFMRAGAWVMSRSPFYYFDNNATTRIHPEVLDAMSSSLHRNWGNPSSVHTFGREAAAALETAREQVASLIHAEPREIVFTSCGTESNNTALQAALATQPGKRHLVTTAVEHPAILRACDPLRKQGVEITVCPVQSDGALDLKFLDASVRPDTALVSVMWANNETGVIFPVEEIAAMCRSRGVLFHTDAVQAAGRIEVDAAKSGVDFLSLSAHKLHGPKGVGALYVRRRTRFEPMLVGGGQEFGRRGGTENVAGIVGFGKAAELARTASAEMRDRVAGLRDRLEETMLAIPGTERNGAKEPRLPNATNLAFADVEAEAVLLMLDQAGICASSGSACASGTLDPSHVLMAMGCSLARARSSVRFSLSVDTKKAEVDYLCKEMAAIIARLRRQPASNSRSTGAVGTPRPARTGKRATLPKW